MYLNTRIRAESIEKRHGDLTTTNNKTIHSNLNMELFQTQQHWVSLTAYLRELRDKQQKYIHQPVLAALQCRGKHNNREFFRVG